jgi:hypothetical protein
MLFTPADALLDAAPAEVRDSLAEVKSSKSDSLIERATTVRLAIETIFEEFGRRGISTDS